MLSKNLSRMLQNIDTKVSLLLEAGKFEGYSIKTLRDKLNVEWIYNSNAIEGNTLTLAQTKVVLEGITIGGKSLREHLEVINHKEAIEYIEQIVKDKEELSEWQIKNIHAIVLKGIDDKNAGVYRKENVFISGAKHIPPDYLLVPEQMHEFIEWYKTEGLELHPVIRAAKVHADFVKIHPFVDGNGRTARLLMNFELLKNGYPIAVIEKSERYKYYEALDMAHTTNDYEKFFKLIIRSIEKTLNYYIKILGVKKEV